MCSLDEQPWRSQFTGPPCRCGVPTPGTEAERVIQNMFELEERAKRKEKAKADLQKFKEDRQEEIFKKHMKKEGQWELNQYNRLYRKNR
jgi:hypothetical protein